MFELWILWYGYSGNRNFLNLWLFPFFFVEEMTQKILDFGVRKLDIPDPHLYFQARGGQVFQLVGINEDRSYYEGAGDGQNVAKLKEAEALKDEAMNKWALRHQQKSLQNRA